MRLLLVLAIVFAFTLLTSKTTEARFWKVQKMRPTRFKKQRLKRQAEQARKQRQRAQRRSSEFGSARFHQSSILDARRRAQQRTSHFFRNDEGVDTKDNLREEKKRRRRGLANLKRKIQARERNVENARQFMMSRFRKRKNELITRLEKSSIENILDRSPFFKKKRQNHMLNSFQGYRIANGAATQKGDMKIAPLRFSDLMSQARAQRDPSDLLAHP